VCRVEVGPRVGGGPLLHSVIGGKGGRRPWRWQLHRAWLSDASGFGASALRSVLPLFGPPEQKSSSSPLLEQVTACRSSAFPHGVGSFVPAEGEPEFHL
jgi:hypothetical protein